MPLNSRLERDEEEEDTHSPPPPGVGATPQVAGSPEVAGSPQFAGFGKSQSVNSPARTPEPAFLRTTSDFGFKSHFSEHAQPRGVGAPAKRGKVTAVLNTLPRAYLARDWSRDRSWTGSRLESVPSPACVLPLCPPTRPKETL